MGGKHPKIISEGQPCRHCGTPVKRRVRTKPPKKIGKGGYYYLWWFVCANRDCKALYMVEAAKHLQDQPFVAATLNQVSPATPETDAYDAVSAEAFVHPSPGKNERRRLRRERKQKKRQRQREKRARKQEKRSGWPEYRAAYIAYIDSPEWRAFRMTVFAARGRTCERCGSEDRGVRNIHHLHYRNLFHEKLEDVQVLCEACHKAAHPKKG